MILTLCKVCVERVHTYRDLEMHNVDMIKTVDIEICDECWDTNIKQLFEWKDKKVAVLKDIDELKR